MADNAQYTINFAGALIGVGMVAILAFVVYMLSYHDLPTANTQLYSTVLGIVGTQVSLVVGYFFGSSANNRKLIEANAQQAQTIAVAQNALTPDTSKTVNLDPGQTASVTAKGEP